MYYQPPKREEMLFDTVVEVVAGGGHILSFSAADNFNIHGVDYHMLRGQVHQRQDRTWYAMASAYRYPGFGKISDAALIKINDAVIAMAEGLPPSFFERGRVASIKNQLDALYVRQQKLDDEITTLKASIKVIA